MSPLTVNEQLTVTRSPTVDPISMLSIRPAKEIESDPDVVPVRNSSKVAVAGSLALMASAINAD
jgi:hypothetical protein